MQKTRKNEQKIDFLSVFDGFSVISPQTTFIERGAKIAKNCVIYPNVYIDKDCVLGENCVVYPNTMLESFVCGENCKIGPNAHTRTNTVLGNNVRLGNFCETKNCIIGDNTKIAHLTYIGDAEVGKNCNIGCGVVFANYDGVNKHKTLIGDNCFVGCNVNLIAPLTIKNNCFIGAGTTVTQNLDKNSFLCARIKGKTKANKGFNKE